MRLFFIFIYLIYYYFFIILLLNLLIPAIIFNKTYFICYILGLYILKLIYVYLKNFIFNRFISFIIQNKYKIY